MGSQADRKGRPYMLDGPIPMQTERHVGRSLAVGLVGGKSAPNAARLGLIRITADLLARPGASVFDDRDDQ